MDLSRNLTSKRDFLWIDRPKKINKPLPTYSEVQIQLNGLVQPVHLMCPGKIMRIGSPLGALVRAGKDEIKRWHNEENRKGN